MEEKKKSRVPIVILVFVFVGFLMSCQKQTTVDDVVNMMTEASGGAEALAALTDQVGTLEFILHSVEDPMTLQTTITAKRPNKIRLDFYGPEGSIVSSRCTDGTTGWIMEDGQRKDMNESLLQEIELFCAPFFPFFDDYLNYQDKGFALRLLADEMVDEQNYMVLQVTDKHDNVRKHYINPESHFTERESVNMPNSEGGWEFLVITMKDYKMVDGIAIPHHMAWHNTAGEMIIEMILKEVKHNTGVDDAVFMAETMSKK